MGKGVMQHEVLCPTEMADGVHVRGVPCSIIARREAPRGVRARVDVI